MYCNIFCRSNETAEPSTAAAAVRYSGERPLLLLHFVCGMETTTDFGHLDLLFLFTVAGRTGTSGANKC